MEADQPADNTVTASGWVVPKSEPYQKPDGTTCREVTQNVSKNGQTQSQDVTLCRTQVAQADGSTGSFRNSCARLG